MFGTRKKILIVVGLMTLIFILDGYLVWSINSYGNNSEKIISNIDIEITKEAEKTMIQASIQTTKEDRQLLDNFFIGKEGEVDFVNNLKTMGDKAGVILNIESATFENYQNSSSSISAELVHVRLKSSGTWSEVVGFWTLLEAMPYRIAIDRVNLSKSTDKKGSPIWSQQIDITAFKKK
ncbi:MAG: hypothetical protein WAV11_03355 [Minisyncoccia bacterium]